MPSFRTSFTPTDIAPTAWHRGSAVFRAFALGLCFLVMGSVIAVQYVRQTIQHRLCEEIETRLNAELRPLGLFATIEGAMWQEGVGLEIDGLQLHEMPLSDVDRESLLGVERLFVQSRFVLTDLLRSWPAVDAVEIEGLVIHARFRRDGSWNVVEALERCLANRPADSPLRPDFPVHIRESSLEISVESNTATEPLIIEGINLGFSRSCELADGESCVRDRVRGSFKSELSGPVEIAVLYDHAARRWEADVDAPSMQLAGPLAGFLAQFVPEYGDLLAETSGDIAMRANVHGALDDDAAAPQYNLQGTVTRFQSSATRLPHPIQNGSFRFEATPGEVKILDYQSRLGYGSINGWARLSRRSGDTGWEVQTDIASVQLTDRMIPWLPQAYQRFWRQYDPSGAISGSFYFSHLNGVKRRTIRSTYSNGSVSYFRFPYRVSQMQGSIDVDDRLMTFSGTAVEAQQTIYYQGRILDPGEEWTGWLAGQCDGRIPINEKMLQAFRPKPEIESTLREFHATGHLSGWGRIERASPHADRVRMRYEIDVHNATINYEKFPYPFYNVHGRLIVENSTTTFREVTGENKNGQIVCNGSWVAGGDINLNYHATRVTLDDELRRALPPAMQRIWSSLRPAGEVDRVDLRLTRDGPDSPVSIAAVAGLGGNAGMASVHPVSFPIRWTDLQGTFQYNDGQVTWRNMTARHDEFQLATSGNASWDAAGWRLNFEDVSASNITPTRELIDALPASLATGIEKLQLNGLFTMRGSVVIEGAHRPAHESMQPEIRVATVDSPLNTLMQWNLNVGIGNGSLVAGVPLRHINGIVSTQGATSESDTLAYGQLSIDSLMYDGIQITHVKGPVFLDESRVAFGTLCQPMTPGTSVPPVTYRAFSGQGTMDAQVLFNDQNEFYIQSLLDQADLQQVIADTTVSQPEVSGTAVAGVRLTGTALGQHTIQGDGFVRLQNARIWRLPLMLALLNVLRIQEPDRTAFDEGKIDFSLHGDEIDIERVELNGNTLTLIGNGRMNLATHIDLDFYTVMGRNRFEIPVISPLFHAGSQQIWWIEVDGTLGNPTTTHNVLPGLNDSLRRLFPELEAQTTGRREAGIGN